MIELEINKIITEAMGKCWHNKVTNYSGGSDWEIYKADQCSRCGTTTPFNPSYTSDWFDYGPMMEWAMEQRWWSEFYKEYCNSNIKSSRQGKSLLCPPRVCTALAEFIKAHPQYFKLSEESV